MLQERPNVRQIAGEPLRRWFGDDYFELIVWFSPASDIIAWELSYDIHGNWRAFKWSPERGCRHFDVDDGEGRNLKASAVAVLRLNNTPSEGEKQAVAKELELSCGAIDCDIARFVVETLR